MCMTKLFIPSATPMHKIDLCHYLQEFTVCLLWVEAERQACTCRKAISVRLMKHICSSHPTLTSLPGFLTQSHWFQSPDFSGQEDALSEAVWKQPTFARATDWLNWGDPCLNTTNQLDQTSILIPSLSLPPLPRALRHQLAPGPSVANVWHN